jgi:hypothetical protein
LTPSEYVWGILQAVTHKEPNEIKVLIEEKSEYPTLERDSIGYVLKVPTPKKPRENLYSLHGMFFDADPKGEASLWRMFRASVYHLCLHASHTDFSIYKNVSSDDEALYNAMFAMSLVEDYAIKGYMRANWPGIVLDNAYANHLTALRFKEIGEQETLAVKIAANLLSYTLTGNPKVALGPDVGNRIKTLWAKLVEIDASSYHLAQLENTKKTSDLAKDRKSFAHKKVETVGRILETFEDHEAFLTACHSPPYTDNYGPNYLFSNAFVTAQPEEKAKVFNDACKAFSIDSDVTKLAEADKILEIESSNMLSDWERSELRKQSLISCYRKLDPKSHFEGFLFPREDFAEYVRTRMRLIGPLRIILDKLKMVKTSEDEVKGEQSGYLDLPTAVQVMATGSENNEVFVRDILSTKSEAWAILIDSSKVLENIQGAVRDVALCLAEVAKELIPNAGSWACYAFDEKFRIIKDFSETYTNECKGRIGGLSSGLKTFLPDAVRLTAKRLASAGEDIKVMLVVSDGYPLGYDNIDYESVEAIKTVNKAGINVIGLGICSSFLKKHFRANTTVNSPAELMRNFVETYLEASETF